MLPTQNSSSVVNGQNDAQGGDAEDEHVDDEVILEHDVNASIIPALVDQVPVPARDINKSIPQAPGRPLLVRG